MKKLSKNAKPFKKVYILGACIAVAASLLVLYQAGAFSGISGSFACAGEGETVNRDPSMGPTDKVCCPGLDEYEISVSYSVCVPESAERCVDMCGDGECQEIVCMGIGCPCAESAETCPADCE